MISVLLPVYNGEKYLSQSIKSILNQTFRDFEFIIVDDGSIDNTEKIVSSFHDTRIKYIKKDHTGLADTLNYGLKLANYYWVARMDADDISLPNRLFTQYNFISENSEFDVVSSWYTIFNKSVEYIIKVPQYHNSIVQKLALFSSICHPAVIYKKEKILQLGGYKNDGNLLVAQDYELWLRAKSKLKFYNIQEILLLYRIHGESNSNNLFKSERNIHYQIQEKYYKNLPLEFNINSNSEQIIMRGFREYFWGDIKTSRIYWRTLGVKLLITPKVFIAYILTFFNRDFVVKFNNYKIWLRMIFFIESIFDKNISDQKKYWEKAIE